MADEVGGWAENLAPQHIHYLQSRGVSPDVARIRGYFTAATKSELADVGFGPAAQNPPALCIPVWAVWPTPEPVLHQIRPDTPRRNADGRILKFEMPLRSTPFLDVHPTTRALVGDPSVPLLITEGVVKADAAVGRMGVCTVGLAGVWNWRGKNDDGGRTVLADLEYVHLQDRIIVICFDSDVMTKPEVSSALERLGAVLHRRGAAVRYAYLDAGDAGAKVGLDDWLVQTGGGWTDLLALTEDQPRTTSPQVAPPPLPDPGTVRTLDVLLNEVTAILERFVAFSTKSVETKTEPLGVYQVAAVALFVVLTYCFEHFDCVPYLNIASPTKRSGKTRTLEILQYLACRAWLVTEITESTLFRKVECTRPTVLIDECDALWKKNTENTQGIRAILNVAYRSSGTIPRAAKRSDGTWCVEEFCPFGPKVLAGILTSKTPDTVRDRCIPIALERRTKDQRTARYRERFARTELETLAAELSGWAQLYGAELAHDVPDLPDALNDRAQDIWEPLLAIADRAGGDWPALAREAALVLSGGVDSDSVEEVLLVHVFEAFGDRGEDRITTEELLRHLVGRGDDSRWAEWWGKDVEDGKLKGPGSRLARLLKPHGIAPKKLRVGAETAKGYLRADFADVWERYGVFSDPRDWDDSAREREGTREQSRSEQVSSHAESSGGKGCSLVPSSSDTNRPLATTEAGSANFNGSIADGLDDEPLGPDTWVAKPW